MLTRNLSMLRSGQLVRTVAFRFTSNAAKPIENKDVTDKAYSLDTDDSASKSGQKDKAEAQPIVNSSDHSAAVGEKDSGKVQDKVNEFQVSYNLFSILF